MKKLIRFIYVSLLAIFIFMSPAYCLSLENWDSKISLDRSGTLHVIESIDYDPKGYLNGVFRTLNANPKEEFDLISISVDGKEISLADKPKKGDKDVFSLSKDDKQIKIKVFKPGKNTFQVKYDYKIKNTINTGKDFDFLKYRVYDKTKDKLKNFSCEIHLEGLDKKVETLSNFDFKSENDLSFSTREADKNKALEFSLIFPKSSFTTYKNHYDLEKQDYIKSYKEELEKNIKKDEERKIILTYGIQGLLALLLLLFLFRYKKIKKKAQASSKKLGHLMPLSPCLASFLTQGSAYANPALFASLLDLERRGFIKIYEEDYITAKSHKKKKNYIFKKIKDDGISKNEKKLFEILFENSDVFESKNINSERAQSPDSFYSKMTTWIKSVNEELTDLGLKPEGSSHYIYAVLSIFVAIAAITNTGFSISIASYKALPSSIFLFVLALYLAYNFLSINTPLGYEQLDYWSNIAKALKQTAKSESEIDLIKSHKEEMLLYRIALGMDYDSNLKFAEAQAINTSSFLPLYWIVTSKRNSLMQESISRSFTGSDSISGAGFSPSSSSGGSATGGGSTGGF